MPDKQKRSSEDWQGSRQYVWKGRSYPSVTTIIGDGVAKQKMLVPWAARTVAEWVADNIEEVQHQLAQDRDMAIDTMKNAQYRTKRDAGARGSSIHDLAERVAAGEKVEIPKGDPMHYLASGLQEYVRDYAVKPKLSEVTVYSLKHGYAGTLDAIEEWGDGRTMLIDYKTGKRPYPEVALQLCAYARADFYDDGGIEHPLPQIDGAAVIHLSDAGYLVREVDIGDETFKAFRAARVIGDFSKRGERVFLT